MNSTQDNSKEAAKPRRPFLQFGLRMLIVLFTIGAVVIGPFMYRVSRQKAAVAWVKANGGTVFFDDHQARFPAWLRALVGKDEFATVTIVKVRRRHVSDLSPIANLSSLQEVIMSNTQVSNLSPLAKLKSLEFLDLGFTQVSDLSSLKNPPSLKQLLVPHTQVSDLAPLTDLTSLESLNVSYSKVSDLSPLASLPRLKILRVNHTQVSDFSPLSHLPLLEMVTIDQMQALETSFALRRHAQISRSRSLRLLCNLQRARRWTPSLQPQRNPLEAAEHTFVARVVKVLVHMGVAADFPDQVCRPSLVLVHSQTRYGQTCGCSCRCVCVLPVWGPELNHPPLNTQRLSQQ